MKYAISALALAALSQGHAIFQVVSVNGVEAPPLSGLRAPGINNPVEDVSSNDLTCGLVTHTSTDVIEVEAGDEIGAWYQHVLGGEQYPGDVDNPIAASHKGPITAWLAKVEDAATSYHANLEWFKIAEDGFDNTRGIWGVDNLLQQDGWTYFAFTLLLGLLAMSSPTPQATAAQPDVLDVDEAAIRGDDADSALGSVASSTTSINSSILRYRQENGRTYHAYKDGSYPMPNDNDEQERLDLQHHLFLMTFENKLYLSPAGRGGHQIHNALDVGTGTGVWANDFADEFPSASVVGVDLSPIQSPFVAPNVNFLVDDIEAPWTFHKKFDFIYSRMMTAALADFPGFFQKAYENLTPGGWFEIADICPITSDDGTLTEDTSTHAWAMQLLEGTRKIGRPFDGAFDYKKQLEAQGFQNVQQVVFKWPQNTWPKDPKYKELGMWNLENITSGLHGLSAAVYTRVLGWSHEEMEVLLAKVRRELKDTRIHSYWPIYVVYGQKPESKQAESDEPESSAEA
ncbi:hypothetical protein BN1723_010432 [Verticillium longisporum]|uniref:lytic cellulose monooxygenase (C4-dehydrogenating) n=1 Tax=Verticillium longisporum TaxID=100787 RepID=A0A0G4KY02_VERLO|nr:hypothetical protein BN1723_010432 [Verticillium longisporum]